MALKLDQLIQRAKEYVELEAETQVLDATFEQRFVLLGREDVVLSVRTADPKFPEWWVVGGGTPMNLYEKSKFASADEAFSFHTGLMLRLAARDFEQSGQEPAIVGYDAFICHASEDKDDFVRPLAEVMVSMGFRIWYDEFELRVGDSLRQSIDRGLVNSEYGIVVLSPAFFRKNWPQYELNSLTARQIDGRSVILPIWHNVGREDVLEHSPALADKVALSSGDMSVQEIAGALTEVFEE